jgi:hypothetical protein
MYDQPEEDDPPRRRRRPEKDLYKPVDQRIPTVVWYIAGALALVFLALMIFRAATAPPDTSTPGLSATPSPASSAATWQITLAAHG